MYYERLQQKKKTQGNINATVERSEFYIGIGPFILEDAHISIIIVYFSTINI